jgi:hypothetical protein
MKCNFCSKIFSSKYSLNIHQKTTKYCLKLQGKLDTENDFECEYCNKKFTVKQNLTSHYVICKEREFSNKIKIEKEQIEKEFNSKIKVQKEQIEKEFMVQLKEKDKEINELKQTIAELKGRLYTLKDDHELIKEIAKQPKTTTNNNILNINTCLDFTNIDKIKDVIENDFNINYALDGQKGLAKFVKDKLLKDDEGNPIYVCTDPSRQIFRYKDNTGEIKKDVEAKKLTEYIVDGGIKKKTVDVASDWYTDDSGSIIIDKFSIMIDPQQSILKLHDDNNAFKKELLSLTV